ncbi:MAG: hypothetical protein E7335_04435 [Clostridiales bacterium]|nr:hypothetical protein [Clostridiales bacterium]
MWTQSEWIWLSQGQAIDQYAEFYDSFFYDGQEAKLFISADSNYAVYLNGNLIFSGQYHDFPHYKIYDTLNLASHCKCGLNHLAIIVWHYGKGNMSYYPGNAAIRYELYLDESLVCYSDTKTLSRQSLCYQCGRAKDITSQLGFGFRYNMANEDDWMTGRLIDFLPSKAVKQELPLSPRPTALPVIKPAATATLIKNDQNTHFLIDLGREETGYLTFRLTSSAEQEVLIAYGEHIEDGGVRRLIHSRDFSEEIRLRKGLNVYTNPFRRLGLRYLELFAESPLQLDVLTVLPVHYPVNLSSNLPDMNELQKRVYDASVRTLCMCMHEHYEDTPWREQALYAMDGRNQMLCGYYAFEEFVFPRANLLLMSKDDRADGLLSICTPSRDDLTIPSFSLHYFTAVREYTQHSGDLTLAREIWPKLTSILNVFLNRMENGLVPVFSEECHWNFYEWSEGMSGRLFGWDEKRFDAALNCLLSLALQSMQTLTGFLNLNIDYTELIRKLNNAIYDRFFDHERNVFINSTEDSAASALVNALAILCGAAQGECALQIASTLASDESCLTPATLSMRCFLYDALLLTDHQRYASFVLKDIDMRYEKMLAAGATTFWETEEGQRAFDNAGSLCHGWSAMPIYYYHTLLNQ